jgi:exodeoxyribonuclease V alpha subunit
MEVADRVAVTLKMPLSKRVLGHAEWILSQRPLNVAMLVARLQFSLELPGSTVRTMVDKVLTQGNLVQINTQVVPLGYYQRTVNIAEEVKRRAGNDPHPGLVRAFSSIRNVTAEQQMAVDNVAKHQLSIITGGPGVGKSHVVRELVAAFPNARVTAPTGRAARNASGKTVHYFKTIQESGKNDFSGIDLIIVDEASMLSTDLFGSVLDMAPTSAHIVLVGDVNQLPPIDAGDVLCDLLQVVPVTTLTTNVRSSSGIQRFAAGILDGSINLSDGDDVHIIPCDTIADVISALATMDDEIVLTPHNKTRIELNKAIQLRRWARTEEVSITLAKDFPDAPRGTRGIASISPGEPNMVCVQADNGVKFNTTLSAAGSLVDIDCRGIAGLNAEAGTVILSGDKVIVTKNTASACNGDIGVYLHSHMVEFPDQDALIPEISETDPGMTLAYCITVHKAQGSEFDVAVLPVTNVSAWDRALLYTAVTRAKKKVVILGTVEDLKKIVRSTRPARPSILRGMLN